MPDEECAEEKQTQHFRGEGHGFGAVASEEYVYFAVLQKIPHDDGRLSADSFDNKALKRGEQSVSRAAYTTKKVFEHHVVRAGENPKGPLEGVATALVD